MLKRLAHVALTLTALATSGCDVFPWLEKAVILPDGHTVARIMIRADGEYRTVVQNDHGQASHSVADPVDNGRREANLYLTPENWLVVIDASGDDAFFSIAPMRAPRDITYDHASRTGIQSRAWRYLGTVVRDDRGSLGFQRPSETAECISLYGEGRSSYRTAYQARDLCPRNNTDRIRLHERLLAGEGIDGEAMIDEAQPRSVRSGNTRAEAATTGRRRTELSR